MPTTFSGMKCQRCGDKISAPTFSDYAAEDGTVCHSWRCSKCHCEFETRVAPDVSTPLPPDMVERFLPALLIM
jgi:hypothetical protein